MTQQLFDALPSRWLTFLIATLLASISHTCCSAEIRTGFNPADVFYSANDKTTAEEDLISDDDFYVDDYSESRIFFSIEALLGGSTLETVNFSDGETDSIRAGSGVYLALGATHLMFDKSMDIGIKGGYLFDSVTAESVSGEKSITSFTRKVVDIFSHYWIGRHGLGGGISYHMNPEFKREKTDNNQHYHNAMGAYAAYLYHFVGSGTALGVKYLVIDYENKDNGKRANGNGWGITFNQLF